MPKEQLDLFKDHLPRLLFADGVSGQLAFELVCSANGLDPRSGCDQVLAIRFAIQRIGGR